MVPNRQRYAMAIAFLVNSRKIFAMNDRKKVAMGHSLAVQEIIVLPGDTNAHDTMFGGLLMKHIDETAAISARRHCRGAVVTASNDGVHFHRPIQRDDIVILESYVCSVGRTSMEIFVKILTETSSRDEEPHVAAISFLTFVALDDQGKPTPVPLIEPESDEEKRVFNEREVRKGTRLKKRGETNELIRSLSSQRK